MDNITILPNVTQNNIPVMFSWYDYILFTVMLLLSSLIGVYFGCFGKNQSTTNEYLMGGKTMKVVPIAISLVASHTSGITILALPADVYKFGATYWLGMISMLILAFITIFIYLPVFYKLQITSTYEYLERRFDRRTRRFASFLFALSLFLYLPIVTYIPALAFSAATGINVHLIAPIVCGVCIFYTTIGGLKAVVWTDTLQFTVTVGAMSAVYILGLKSAGGFMEVWNTAIEGHRLDLFDFDINPTKRETFWAIMIGLTVHWVAHTSINQGCTQKFLAVPTLKDANLSVIYYCFGMCLVKTVSVLTGLIMFKKYSQCDPFTTKHITRDDQLLPYYVMDVAGSIPGLSGLFIAGVFCAALSTLSANLNCLAGTIYEDFLSKWLASKNSQKSAGYIMKIIVIVTGIISTLMVYVVEHLGGLLSLAIGLGSVAHGPLLGMFTLGVLCPRANNKGAFYGALCSTFFMAVILVGANYYKSLGLFHYASKPLSIDGCDFPINPNLTAALNMTVHASELQPFFLFRLSFYWYTLTGTLVAMFLGLIISYMTNKDHPPVHRSLLSPVIHFMLPKDEETPRTIENHEFSYYSVKKALQVVVNGGQENNHTNHNIT